MGWAESFFCDPPRQPRGVRWWGVAFRSVHLPAAGVILGALAFDVPEGHLRAAIWLVVLSGLALLAQELVKSGTFLYSGAGAGLWLKLGLLGLGHLVLAARFELYVAGTVVASVAAHMPRGCRHALLWHGPPGHR